MHFAILMVFLPVQESVLTGTVVDETGNPLPGAHIIVTELERGTVSGREGNFEMENLPPGTYVIQVSMVGYGRLSLEITLEEGGVRQVTLELQPITLTSGEIRITAARRPQVAGSVPVSMSTVNAAELERRNVISLDESLRYIPGVQVAEEQVNIRGSSGYAYGVGSRVLLLVDGVPLMGPGQADIKMDIMPMSRIERIEVVRGPGSALYGSGAMGGVINLITKDFSEEPETMVRGYSGFYEPAAFEEWKENWDGAAAYRPFGGIVFSHSQAVTGDLGFWINGAYSDNSGYLENTSERALQLYSKTGWNIADNMRLDLFTGFRGGRKEQFLYWNGINDPFRRGRINFGGTEATGGNHVQSEFYSLLPSFRHFVDDTFYYTIRGRGYAMAARPLDREGKIRDRDQHTTGFRYGGEWEAVWFPDQRQSLVAGATFDDIVARSEFFIGHDSLMLRNQPEYAAFAQYDRNLSRKITASGGLRFDGYRIDTGEVATRLSPRFSIAFNVTEALLLRGAFGLGFRAPSVSERFVNNRDFLPLEFNLDLRPEESIGFEAGTNYVVRIPDIGSLEMHGSLFWNEYEGLIEPKFREDLGAFQFVNVTKARIRGVEIEMSATDVSDNHELKFGYTFLEPEDLTLNEPLAYRPRHQVTAGLHMLLPGRVSAGLDFRYLSLPERQDSDFNLFVPDADAMVPVYVFDIRLIRRFSLLRDSIALTAALATDNVFRYYYVERPAIMAPTRNTSLRIQMDF